MKRIAYILMMALAFIVTSVPVVASTKSIHAVVTFYWPGETGGRYDCDGHKLHKGIAAVDFDIFPKGSVLNIGNRFSVIAKDCGGRAIISRKAARERGVHCPVIDVWAHSEKEAMRIEADLPKVVLVTYEPSCHVAVNHNSKRVLLAVD